MKISKKYGLNPSVEKCAVCGKDMSVVLFGTSYKDTNGKTAEAPREVCLGHLCEDCQKVLDQGGVFIIEVRDGESGNNPYRTGRLIGIKREAAERMFRRFTLSLIWNRKILSTYLENYYNIKTMRIKMLIMLLWVSIVAIGQTHFDLLPSNMQKYVGKITKNSLEHLIGPAFDEAEGFYYYEVINTYDNIPTGIVCYFREADSVLVSCKFPTPHYAGYLYDFTTLRGFPKRKIAEQKGNIVIKRDALKNPYWINLKFKEFGCQIFDIKRRYGLTTAVINYHTNRSNRK